MNVAQKIEAAEAASHAMPSDAVPSHGPPRYARPHQATPGSAKPCHDASNYHRKLERVLSQMGSVYLLDDILAAIAAGTMQSFVVNNSWAITQVQDFPRARQLQLIAMVGDLADVDALHAALLTYADEVNAGLLTTYGRRGWLREGSWERLGWRLKATSHLYQRSM